MSKQDIICRIDKNIILAKYEPSPIKHRKYQSEAELEDQLMTDLNQLGIPTLNLQKDHEKCLLSNLKQQMEELNKDVLNNEPLTTSEWEDFKRNGLFLGRDSKGIEEKSEMLHKDGRYTLTREKTGLPVNLKLIDKERYYNNKYQVIHQYIEPNGDHESRYDTTILVNGLPLVHIELKRRGVRIRDAFNQIRRYHYESFGSGTSLFEWVQIFVISNGTSTKYYANTTRKQITSDQATTKTRTASFAFTTYWADEYNHHIEELEDFTRYFLSPRVLWSILTKYCVFNTNHQLLVMRPYQICAVEKTLSRINRNLGGYIWHTTGSGKTLTSFKLAQLARLCDNIEKSIFIVDRRDLDYQSQKEYDTFEKGSANGTRSTKELKKLMESDTSKIIITTINKLSEYLKSSSISKSKMVLIFDECHRSTFGEQFEKIKKKLPNSIRIGFTGTPIFPENAVKTGVSPTVSTTKDLFGDCIHTYTVVDAIADHNVLPFKVDFIDTIKMGNVKDGTQAIEGIDKRKAMLSDQRIENISKDIISHFDKKTQNKRYSAILATDSIEMAIKYYHTLNRLDKNQYIKKGIVYTYSPNDDYEEIDEIDELDETDQITPTTRQELESAIDDYNKQFGTQFSPSNFTEYYKDVTRRLRLKDKPNKKETPLDLVIVVNMMLTGYDAKTLNTLYVDKDLHHHLLLQAYSRTNRILNETKTHGNIVCYRNLESELKEALELFGAKEHENTIILRTFEEYYSKGYDDHKPYVEIVNSLKSNYPPSWFTNPIITRDEKKGFIQHFSIYLRTKHILESFDEFDEPILTPYEEQDYRSHYLDFYDELKPKRSEKEDIRDELDFCLEIVSSTSTSLDYIINLVSKASKGKDRELTNDEKAMILATPEARPKIELIEQFIKQISCNADFDDFKSKQMKEDLDNIISKFNLKPEATRQLVNGWMRKGEIPVFDGQIYGKLIKDTPKGQGMLTGFKKRNESKERLLEALEDYYNTYTMFG